MTPLTATAATPAPDVDFVKQLELVAYGCHKKTEDNVRSILNSEGVMTFKYLEFFFDCPIIRAKVYTKDELEEAVEEVKKERRLYLPFIKRLIEHSNFLPRYNEKTEQTLLESKDASIVEERLKYSRNALEKLDNLPVAPHVIEAWLNGESFNPRDNNFKTSYFSTIKSYKTKSQVKKIYARQDDKIYHLSFEMNASQYLLTDIRKNPLYAIEYPICSKNILYGYIIIHFQLKEGGGKDEQFRRIRRKLYDALEQAVNDFFFPTMLLFHVTQYERRLTGNKKEEDKVEFDGNDPYRKFFKKIIDLKEAGNNNFDSLESAFGKRFKEPQKKRFYLFEKYNVISPTMMQLIRRIAEASPAMRQPKHDEGKNSLPSALIYGEAGSGKDILAKLIPQFTDDYYNGEVEVINMAALKPNALAIPTLMGFDVASVSRPGLLTATTKETDPNETTKRTLIFDELNSLDYDLQGSLLRVLENGEVHPLFGKKETIDHLIIGIINEDPQSISREREVELLGNAETLLGKILNTYIKEGIIHSRRLRPDLMYRLMRGLFLELPPLNQRREDIPILFFTYCKQSLKSILTGREVDLDFDLSAIELLMDEKFNWTGNVRQLQKVAKDAAVILNTNGDGNGKYKLTESVVNDTLSKTFDKPID